MSDASLSSPRLPPSRSASSSDRPDAASNAAREATLFRVEVSTVRRAVRARRRLAWAVLLAPGLGVVGIDFALRGDRILEFPAKYYGSYAAAAFESCVLWGLLLYASSRRRGAWRHATAALFVALAGVVVGGQIYFHRQYSIYLNLDATLFGASVTESLFSQIAADGFHFVTSMGLPSLFAAALVAIARRVVRPRRTPGSLVARALAPLAVLAAGLIPCSYRSLQGSTPDIIYLHAVTGLGKVLLGVQGNYQIRPTRRTPEAVPSARPSPPVSRNVLFVLTESVRADLGCSDPSAPCEAMPRTHAALPHRLPLLQMRATSSTTAIQLAVLWGGVEPIESRERLHSAPLVFDYAHAAGLDTAYLSAHHLLFANARLFVQDLPTKHQCGATDLDPLADIDMGARDDLLTERAKRDLPTLREPFFAVVHYSNTHVPYLVDPADAPFQPAKNAKGPEDNEAYRNYYKNAVHRQDKTIAELLAFVRSQPFGARTAVVFTSDHGEAFREHGQLGHTSSVLDEEIHVPFWIDAPAGVLTDAERSHLAAARTRPSFHTDVTPTLLDLLGLWDAAPLRPLLRRLVGSSLLREAPPERAHVLTNCTGIWGCAFRSWGVMRGARKLEAREWDADFHCYDLSRDPLEKTDLGPARCPDLLEEATRHFGGPPTAVPRVAGGGL